MEKAKEGNRVIYTNGSKSEAGRVQSGCMLHERRIQGKAGLEKITKVWEGKIKGIVEALMD